MGGTGALENEEKGANSGSVDRRWSFGSVVLDERTLELVVSGEAIAIERKPLEVLLFLLNHAGEVVTKDEILEAVWPGRILTESVLTKCIAKIREALHDENSELIKTQHGYGYRLVAKVNVEASSAPPPPRFDFKPGDHPPSRPNWNLVERLGTGGHGEVWLARHEKTREPRVFKFALDTAALASLKREITLYRVLHDTLGGNASIVEIHEWNLEQPPYFIEGEYVESGSLVNWAEAQGGLKNLPLETRLDIAAQIAEILAAAHSVGVLHKDLKPSNILIVSSPLPTDVGRGRAEGAGEGRVQIKLADFGSGGVLDPHRLEQMGITRLGFTKTVAATGTTSGTPIYLAPEVIAGQPFTVQADIYALGVVLYQLVIGSFKKSLAPGWELGIEDELLREDIASAAAGDLSRRLADAAELGRRLRTLDRRWTERAEERKARELVQQAKVDAERAQQAMERMRVRRRWMAATVVVLLGGLAGSLWLYRDAAQARDTGLAVSTFLTQDVLSMADPYQAKPKEMTVKAMIDRAAKLVDQRLVDQPEAAAQVHFALAHAYSAVEEQDALEAHARRAETLLKDMYGEDDLRTILARLFFDYYVEPHFFVPEPEKEVAVWQRLNAALMRELGPDHPQIFESRILLAERRHLAGQITAPQAVAEMREAITHFKDVFERTGQAQWPVPGKPWALFLPPLANNLEWMLQFKQFGLLNLLLVSRFNTEAVELASEQLIAAERRYGENHYVCAAIRGRRGQALQELGRYEEAEVDFRKAVELRRAWLGNDHNETHLARHLLGNLLLHSGDYAGAEKFYRNYVIEMAGRLGPDNITTVNLRAVYAEPLMWLGRFDESEDQLRQALQSLEKRPPDESRMPRRQVRQTLARLLRERGRLPEVVRIYQTLLGECDRDGCHPLEREGLNFMYARAKHESGDLMQVEELLRGLLTHHEQADLDDFAKSSVRMELADVLRKKGRLDEAWSLINSVKTDVPQASGTPHMLGNVHRVRGLLLLHQGKPVEARAELLEAERQFLKEFGATNWRTKRAREELAKVEAAARS